MTISGVKLSPGVRAQADTIAPVAGAKPPASNGVSVGDTLNIGGRAAGSGQYLDVSAIDTLKRVDGLTTDAQSLFTVDGHPTVQYQSQKVKKGANGKDTIEITYDWHAALTDVAAKLQAIADTAGAEDDPQCQKIAGLARDAVNKNHRDDMWVGGLYSMRYANMAATLDSIQALAKDRPNQPGQTMGRVYGAIAGADANLADLRNQLNNQTLVGGDLEARVNARVARYRVDAAGASWWRKLTGGAKRKASADATALQADFDAYRRANADDLAQRLNAVKSRAAGLDDQAQHAFDIPGARALQGAATPVVTDATALRDQAGTTRDQVRDLIARLGGS